MQGLVVVLSSIATWRLRRIGGPIHFAHATGSQDRNQRNWAEAGTGSQGHCVRDYMGETPTRTP